MNKIKVHTAEKELYYEGEVIVKYSIEYPEIIETPYLEGKEIFNKYNRKQAIEL